MQQRITEYICKQEDIKSIYKSRNWCREEEPCHSEKREITAFHEAGHAILFHVLPDVGPVYTVSRSSRRECGRIYDAASREG